MKSYQDYFDIPKLEYFEFKNVYTGSAGKLEFRIDPTVGEGKMEVKVWSERVCFELCTVEDTATFDITADGLEEMKVWLEAECKKRMEE